MVFLYITAAISVLDYILYWLVTAKARYMFKSRYPELKIPKSHWSEAVLNCIKVAFYYFCPVLNIVFALVYLFKTDEICDNAVAKTYQRCMEEGTK